MVLRIRGRRNDAPDNRLLNGEQVNISSGIKIAYQLGLTIEYQIGLKRIDTTTWSEMRQLLVPKPGASGATNAGTGADDPRHPIPNP